MKVENNYDVYPTEDGRFLLAIQVHEKPIENPHIVYANGRHAILYRNNDADDAVVLDFLAEEAQKLMANNKRAIVVELDGINPIFDYIAEIELRDKLPVMIMED